MDAGDPIVLLRQRALSYPPARYPVQHATAQFHLGLTLTHAGLVEEADSALVTAVELFDPELLPAEHAASTNALGVARRARGRLDEAADAFHRALGGFERAGRALERAAALHNLGLVEAQRGRPGDAARCFEEARSAFAEVGHPANAAAAARELGAALLASGDLERAATTLADALDRAERAGDVAGAGAAANTLGLAHLARNRPREAAEAFRRSAAAHPRRLRREGYAVAKANLALAWRWADEPSRALLAAGQALAVPDAPGPAREVALEAAAGAEPDAGALAAVMVVEEPDEWPGTVRDELNRWLDLDEARRAAEAAAWVQAVLDHGAPTVDLVAVWFAIVLELHPSAMETLLRALLRAVSDRAGADQQVFRRASGRAMATFAAPQLLRLQDTIERLAEEAGVTGPWR